MDRIAAAGAALIALAAPTAGCAEGPEATPQAFPIVERTKTVDTTYANYNWNRIIPPDGPVVEEWSAEFHSGSLHRVETPRDRLIADCENMTGVALSLETGEKVSGPQVAGAACGINTNTPILSARVIGRVDRAGSVSDRIEVVDRDNVRIYDVTEDGVIVRATYASSEAPERLILETWSVALERELPAADMFSSESLRRSFVPDRFKREPTE
ncbi:MAG TPA: hypothetical protein VEB68_05195 [Croceibacterium sp.]|nr:hypothetical protein [Croceibacterium sp.]